MFTFTVEIIWWENRKQGLGLSWSASYCCDKTLTKYNLGRKGMFWAYTSEATVCITEGTQGRNLNMNLEAEIQTRPWRDGAYWFYMAFSTYF